MLTIIVLTIIIIQITTVGYLLVNKNKLSHSVELTKLEEKFQQFSHQILKNIHEDQLQQQQRFTAFKEHLSQQLHQQHHNQNKHQLESIKLLQDSILSGLQDIRLQVTNSLNLQTQQLNRQVDKLTETTNEKLLHLSGKVEERLAEGFEKTTATFADILQRLALIDQAQKKITELSTHVVSLQEVLSDKKSRGLFGEVQLANLIQDVIPEGKFKFQYSLSNGKRADCILFLPQPTGNIVVDAKFPLESYRKLTNLQLAKSERMQAEKQFRIDIRKHIEDIATKYIIENETSDGAIMFLPAEAVFAEIHGHFPELVDFANQQRVWIVSPTTLMAVLTTARAVLKDAATRKQVHIIQEHLGLLSQDFHRFEKRMQNLAKHVEHVHKDVGSIQASAKKITSRFDKIERVELDDLLTNKMPLLEEI